MMIAGPSPDNTLFHFLSVKHVLEVALGPCYHKLHLLFTIATIKPFRRMISL